MLLKIFSAIEATSLSDSRELDDMTTQLYEEVTDDFLTVLVDGYQKRCGLPMVCKRWKACLAQPSYVWAYLNIDFHELWNVQQVTHLRQHSGLLNQKLLVDFVLSNSLSHAVFAEIC